MTDIVQEFGKFVNTFFPIYRGLAVERKSGGYLCLGKWHSSMEDLDKAIDEHLKTLNSSINRLKPTNNE